MTYLTYLYYCAFVFVRRVIIRSQLKCLYESTSIIVIILTLRRSKQLREVCCTSD